MRSPTQVPDEIIQKWQEIVDLLAEIMHVPSALIMKVEPPNIRVLVSSESSGNPYEPDEIASLNTGLYCETVMKTRRPLLVPDALADEDWKSNPDIKLGMISYLGFPVTWPNGEIFGTICVLDSKRNTYSEVYRRLLLQHREVLQADLKFAAIAESARAQAEEALQESMTECRQAEALLAGEKRILEMVARGDSQAEILDSLCQLVEEQARDVLATVLVVDGDRLRLGGGSSLVKAITPLDGVVIGPRAGSCGTAAYRGKQVIVSDIATDPLWANFRDVALSYSLRACWSTPIFSSEGKVIATFAMYYREPRAPSVREQQIVEQISHLAGVAIQRKLTQEALKKSEERYRDLINLSADGIYVINPQGICVLTNPAGAKLARCSEEQLIGTPFSDTYPPYDRHLLRERMEKSKQGPLRYEREFLRTDGEVVPVDVSFSALPGVGHQAVVRDISARKRAEEAARQAQADLAHINRVTTMGELASSLAHELNQPIAAAITNANTCLRWLAQADLEEAREAAIRIVKDGTRAAEIIGRIRSFYKKSGPQREWLDVNQIAREMLVLVRSEANRYSISMRIELANELPKVLADRVQLQQVFMNLMLNAVEAMRDVDGKRELTIKSGRGEGEQLVISIHDTGVGLPSAQTDRIFKPFFTTKPQGTGMGLAISRSIIESHGGRLWGDANVGPGATFCFSLPTQADPHLTPSPVLTEDVTGRCP